jgi:hypothetical protein
LDHTNLLAVLTKQKQLKFHPPETNNIYINAKEVKNIMRYEKPSLIIADECEVCNEAYSSGVVVAAALAIVIVLVTPTKAY